MTTRIPIPAALADEAARSINACNARTTRPAERAADFVVAVVLVALGVAALLHYFTPCDVEGALCLAAAIPLRRSWHRRLREHLRRMYLNGLVHAARSDIRAMEDVMAQASDELELLPRQIAVHRRHIDGLLAELAALDTPGRG